MKLFSVISVLENKSPSNIIYVKKILKTENAVSNSDAEILVNRIIRVFQKHAVVIVSFLEIKKISVTFIKEFYRNLRKHYNFDYIESRIILKNLDYEKKYNFKKVYNRYKYLEKTNRLRDKFKKFYYKF